MWQFHSTSQATRGISGLVTTAPEFADVLMISSAKSWVHFGYLAAWEQNAGTISTKNLEAKFRLKKAMRAVGCNKKIQKVRQTNIDLTLCERQAATVEASPDVTKWSINAQSPGRKRHWPLLCGSQRPHFDAVLVENFI